MDLNHTFITIFLNTPRLSKRPWGPWTLPYIVIILRLWLLPLLLSDLVRNSVVLQPLQSVKDKRDQSHLVLFITVYWSGMRTESLCKWNEGNCLTSMWINELFLHLAFKLSNRGVIIGLMVAVHVSFPTMQPPGEGTTWPEKGPTSTGELEDIKDVKVIAGNKPEGSESSEEPKVRRGYKTGNQITKTWSFPRLGL